MMGNLSIDMFVMRKKKSTYITALLVFACALVGSLLIKYAGSGDASEGTFTNLLVQSGTLAFMFLGIFYSMFLGSDLKNGFIKNTAGTVKNRTVYILSKEITLAVYTIVGIAVLTLGSFIFSTLFLNGTKNFELMPFVKYIGTAYLLLVGFTSFITFLVFSVRNTVAPMVIGILLTSGTAVNIIYNPVEMLLSKADVNFDFKYISAAKNLLALTAETSNKDMLIACAVAVGHIIVFNILTKIVMDKKDIA